jgi:DNA-binding response OmpR family regulator
MAANPTKDKKRRILIADTDPDSRIIVASIMTVLGHTPVVVQNGGEAIAESQNSAFDLAILDYTISDINGLEVCHSIKSRYAGDFIPVLMLTERDTLSDKVKAFAEGVDDYLTKPFYYEELQARVNAMLRIRDLHYELRVANQELQKAQHLLIEQERQLAVGQLAGTAAHQLGQPLSSILLNCFLIEQLPKSDHKFVGAVAAIKGDAKRMADMIDQLRMVKASDREEYLKGTEILKLGSTKSHN